MARKQSMQAVDLFRYTKVQPELYDYILGVDDRADILELLPEFDEYIGDDLRWEDLQVVAPGQRSRMAA